MQVFLWIQLYWLIKRCYVWAWVVLLIKYWGGSFDCCCWNSFTKLEFVIFPSFFYFFPCFMVCELSKPCIPTWITRAASPPILRKKKKAVMQAKKRKDQIKMFSKVFVDFVFISSAVNNLKFYLPTAFSRLINSSIIFELHQNKKEKVIGLEESNWKKLVVFILSAF